MTITANLADGRQLNFPDGTDPAVIQATVKRTLGVQDQAAAPPEQQMRKRPEPFGRSTPQIAPGGIGLAPETISTVARPTLEAVGGGVGALAGAPAGPIGSVAGGGLGFAIGSELADKLDEFLNLRTRQPLSVELGESAKDVLEGATMEAGGQALVAGGGQLLKTIGKRLPSGIPFTSQAAAKKAGKVIAANTTGGPVIAKNIEEARALEEAIPGLKFGRGQLTEDPEIIKFERAQARAPGDVARIQQEQAEVNTKAIQDFIDKQKGAEGIGEVITPLEQQRAGVEALGDVAKRSLASETERLGAGVSPVEAGEIIKKEAKAGEAFAKKTAGKLFESVPQFDIDASSLIGDIDEIAKPFSKVENIEKNVPGIFGRLRKVIEEAEGTLTPDDLQGVRSELAEDLRASKSSATPNRRLESRLTGLIGKVDKTLEKAGESARGLKTARGFFKKEVVEKFRTGPVGEILKPGAGGDKVTNAGVVAKFFKPGPQGAESAKQFLTSLGDNPEARGAIEDAIKQDLVSKATNPVTQEITESKLKGWLQKHGPALDELGIKNKFDTLVEARGHVDEAVGMKTAFDKSVASKFLKSDVDRAVGNAFASGSKKASANELMARLKGDKKAVAGLQNSLIDHIIKGAELSSGRTSFDKVTKEIKKFQPALDVIFHGSPEKLKALKQYHAALKRLQVGTASPLGGGSDTFENTISFMAQAAGLTGSRLFNVVKAVMKPFKDLSEAQVTAFKNRAAVDPEFAFTLQLMAGGMPVDMVENRLKGHLVAMGIRAARPKRKEK